MRDSNVYVNGIRIESPEYIFVVCERPLEIVAK